MCRYSRFNFFIFSWVDFFVLSFRRFHQCSTSHEWLVATTPRTCCAVCRRRERRTSTCRERDKRERGGMMTTALSLPLTSGRIACSAVSTRHHRRMYSYVRGWLKHTSGWIALCENSIQTHKYLLFFCFLGNRGVSFFSGFCLAGTTYCMGAGVYVFPPYCSPSLSLLPSLSLSPCYGRRALFWAVTWRM